MCVWVGGLCVFVRVFMCVCAYACAYICVRVYGIYMRDCMHACECVYGFCVYVFVCVRDHLRVRAFKCVYV